ncbi:unnamed protein product [Camellia sinensis]
MIIQCSTERSKFMDMQCLEVGAALKDSMYHSMAARHGWKHPDTKRVEFHIMLLLMMIYTVTNGHGCFLKLKVMSSTIQRLLPKQLTQPQMSSLKMWQSYGT